MLYSMQLAIAAHINTYNAYAKESLHIVNGSFCLSYLMIHIDNSLLKTSIYLPDIAPANNRKGHRHG